MESTELLGLLVTDILAAAPPAARVFLERGMACPGCPFASFETLADVAQAYGTDPIALAAALVEAGAGEPASGGRIQ
jgi:hybrid cluster-associated redox disulfide protein